MIEESGESTCWRAETESNSKVREFTLNGTTLNATLAREMASCQTLAQNRQLFTHSINAC